MRTATNIITRNFGVLEEEPIKGNKVYASGDEPILEDLGEGEFILDRNKNRPLVKVGGELKQMKVDKDGYVFYDTPIDSSMVQSLSQALEQIQPTVDTNETFYFGFYINPARINNVALRPVIQTKGTILKRIIFDIVSAFDGNFTFELNMVFGGFYIHAGDIDFTSTGLRPFEYNKYDPVNALTTYTTTVTTPPTTGLVYVLLEFGRGTYV
jgi:hypothetical protein